MFCLIDCNNFYVSCEKVFNPKLKNKPCVVLSNNDGCIIARSNEAKSLNIKMGDPIFLYQRLINEKKLNVYSSNFALYGDMSNRVMQIIKSLDLETEFYSIDEAFIKLDMPLNLIFSFTNEIKNKIEKWTGIPVSIAVAPTKTLAKTANEKAKKENKVIIINDKTEIDCLLEKTSVSNIWSIGSKSSEILKRLNIINAKQLKYTKDEIIKKHLKLPGYRTCLELRSTPCFNIENSHHLKKSILCSRSFPKLISSYQMIKEALANFTANAAIKLRKQKSVASCITVFIATNRFNKENYYTNSHTIGLTTATDYTPTLLNVAMQALNEIFIENLNYKKVGIYLSSISKKETVQEDFFSKIESSKNSNTMQVLDKINSKFNKKSLFFASQGTDFSWIDNQSKKSKKYTTSWDELLTV